MRLIDANKLKAVLQNIKEHLEESGEPQSVEMGAVFAHVMEIVDMQSTIALPPNVPLTLDELREMGGEPVWAEMLEPCPGCFSRWNILSKNDIRWICDGLGKAVYGKAFVYYRRKPETSEEV